MSLFVALLDLMTYDLHMHSNCSDGELPPGALLLRAASNGIECLSITDHDTLAAYDDPAAWPNTEVQVVPGIELSTHWRGRGIHVLGLNVDPSNQRLRAGVNSQQQARQKRAGMIADRLKRAGLDVSLERVQELAGKNAIGRPHFARHLTEIGAVGNEKKAFRRYLGAGKPGDVAQLWAAMPSVVAWIVEAGGTAALAHPAHYNLTHFKLQQLVVDFTDAGGRALEVVSGAQAPKTTQQLARVAADNGLLASCGSDFHRTGSGWSDIGKFPPLPASCTPVWTAW